MLAEEEYVENTQPTAEPEYQEPEVEIIDDEPEAEEAEEENSLSPDEASLLQEDEGGLEEAPDPLELANKKIAELRKKLDKTNRHYVQTRQQADELQKQLEQTQRDMQEQAKISAGNIERGVEQRIAMATKKLKEAKENGDIDAETEAISELQQANISKSKIEDHKWQQKLNDDAEAAAIQAQQAQQEGATEEYDPYYLNKENFNGWLEQNDYWLNPQSPQHNPMLFEGVDRFLSEWNAAIIESGREDYIGSDEYNELLTQRVNEANAKLNAQRRRQPQMKPVQRAGAPVRGPSRAPAGNAPIKLERREYEMLQGLRNHGFKVKTETYLAKKEALANKRGPWG
jgi:hypothetical protein